MPINVIDDVEARTVAVGAAIINLQGGDIGVTRCVVQPNQQLRTNYSYRLQNTGTGNSQSAECVAPPGRGMQIASFRPNLAAALRPAQARAPRVAVQIRAGANHVFPAAPNMQAIEVDNRHNVAGSITYQIQGRGAVQVPMRVNEDTLTIPNIHGLQTTVTNNLAASIYCTVT